MKPNKNVDFHIPFIKGLVLVALVTLFAMISSHYIVDYYMGHQYYYPIFTSAQSYSSADSPENNTSNSN